MIDKADYTKYRALSTVTTQSADQTSQIKQAQRQGNTMESVHWFHGGKFVHEMKTKCKDKKWYKMQ